MPATALLKSCRRHGLLLQLQQRFLTRYSFQQSMQRFAYKVDNINAGSHFVFCT